LKIGVAIMALGAAARGAPVQLVPFGINYNQAHKWRSKVLVDIGKPLFVDSSMIERFKQGAMHETEAELLKQIELSLRAVTFNAPDKHTLNILRTMRRLYQGSIVLPVSRYMELNRRFALAFGKFQDDDRFLDLVARVHDYMENVSKLGLIDSQVAALPALGSLSVSLRAVFVLMADVLIIFCGLLFSIPGDIIFLPLLLRVRYVAKDEVKKALAGSSVKVRGEDVEASNKIISTFIWTPVTLVVAVGIATGLSIGLWPKSSPYPSGSTLDWFFANAVWLIPVAVLILVPVVGIANVVILDNVFRRIKWFPYHLIMIESTFKTNSRGNHIRLRRKELSLRIQEFMDKIIMPAFPEWNQDLIITRDAIIQKRRKSDHNRAQLVAAEIDELANTMPDSPTLAASRRTIKDLKPSMRRMEDNAVRFDSTDTIGSHDSSRKGNVFIVPERTEEMVLERTEDMA